MLTRVEIHEFRSCREVVLDNLGGVTALVGRNAVGKTNILRAIQWAADMATGTESRERRMRSGRVSLQFELVGRHYEYTLERKHRGVPKGPSSLGLAESLSYQGVSGKTVSLLERGSESVKIGLPDAPGEVKISKTASCLPALIALLSSDSPILDHIRPCLTFFEGIRYYPFVQESDEDNRGVILKEDRDDWLALYRQTGNPGESVLLRLLHLYLEDASKMEEIRDILGPNGLGIVDDINVMPLSFLGERASKEESETWYRLLFRPGGQGKEWLWCDFPDLSEGTRRIITLLVSLLFDRSGVMLLEHPEDAIHRGLLRKVIGLLQTYSDQSQLILTSHSPVVFNALDPASVRLVTMEEGWTKARTLSAEELGALESYLENEGSIAEFLETVEED